MPDVIDEIVSELKTPEQRATFRLVVESAAVRSNPFSIIRSGKLFIKTKDAQLIPLKLNRAQLRLLEVIEAKWNKGEPIRVLVLKARQLGISTLVEAIIYAITAYTENTNSLIIADDSDGAGYIFEMTKVFHEKIEKHLLQPVKKSNAQELVFDGVHSQIQIDTAKNENAGRKFTFRAVHLSEYAFYPHADLLMAGLSQAVPLLPKTMIVKESTANGFNYFREEWMQAKAGKSSYIPVFIPWYWDEGYMMPKIGFVIGDMVHESISKDELALSIQMRDEGIDHIEERLAWRRMCIRDNCQGSVETFQQEYPSNDFEAFLASGQCYFDKHKLIKRLTSLEKQAAEQFRGNIIESNQGFELRRDPQGVFTFYEEPNDANKYEDDYTVAGDASGGSSTDWTVLEVRRKMDNKQIAVFRAKVEPPELAEKARLLGSFFNDAVVAIENDKFGFAANQILKNTYGNIYHQERVSTDGSVTEKYGWDTNSVTRPMMLAALEDDIRKGALEINNIVFLNECLTFIRNDEKGRVEGEVGCNDDCVITMAINSALRQLHPWKPKMTSQVGVDIKTLPKNRGFGFGKK